MNRPCPKCLAGEAPRGRELAELIRERIRLMPEEERTPENAYRQRLEICRQCDFLFAGTCAKCGCYVELRAAKARMGCPDVPARW